MNWYELLPIFPLFPNYTLTKRKNTDQPSAPPRCHYDKNIKRDGSCYHVAQRGNYRQGVSEGDEDYRRYLQWLRQYSGNYGLKIRAIIR